MSETKLNFKDFKTEESREEWWSKELAECAHCYRIPMHNLPLPLTFRRPPKVCVDIGANVGTFSFYSSDFFESIYAYEAINSTYDVAKENLKDKKNVTVYNLAVSNKSGDKIKLSAYESGLSGDTSVYNVTDESPYELCETIDLEKIYEDNEIDYIDYMKVDCEGSEYDFLMNKDLSRISFLVMELHNGYLGQKKTEELLQYLNKFFDLQFKIGDHILFFREKEV